MKEKQRNMAIGLTVLVSLVILCAMIIMFAGLPEVFAGGTKMVIHAPHTGNLQKGDKIYLRGMRVGEITDVDFTQDNPAMGVTITGVIDDSFRLPRNTIVSIETQGLTNMASLAIWPGQDDGRGFYEKGETVIIENLGQGGSSLIPKEVSDAMSDFAQLARSLNNLVSGPADDETTTMPTTAPTTQTLVLRKGLAGTVDRLNRTLDSIYAISGDAKSQQDIKESIENLKTATQQMTKLLATADNLSRELITDAEETGKLVKGFQKTVDAINEGDGTVAKLINDPAVYNNLLQVTAQLEGLIQDLRRLSDQWERNGVGVKLK